MIREIIAYAFCFEDIALFIKIIATTGSTFR